MDRQQADRLETKLQRLSLWLFFLGAPLLILFLIFGLPIVGNIAASIVADNLGCVVNASIPHACLLFGRDIGDVLYNYAVTSLFAGIVNPVLFFSLLSALLTEFVALAWIIAVIVLYILRRGVKHELDGA